MGSSASINSLNNELGYRRDSFLDNNDNTNDSSNMQTEQLRIQAISHWNRMIKYANDNKNNKPMLPDINGLIDLSNSNDFSDTDIVSNNYSLTYNDDSVDISNSVRRILAAGGKRILTRTTSSDSYTMKNFKNSNSESDNGRESQRVEHNLNSKNESTYTDGYFKSLKSYNSNDKLTNGNISNVSNRNDFNNTAESNSNHNNQLKPSTASKINQKRFTKIQNNNVDVIKTLQLVKIILKSRNANSITLSYDIDYDTLNKLQHIINYDNSALLPFYEINYCLYNSYVDYTKDDIDTSVKWSKLSITTETTVTLNNLSANTQYYIRCRRTNLDNVWSSIVIRTGPGVPSKALNLTAKEVTSTSILIGWSPPAKDNGLPLMHYIARMKLVGADFKELYKGKDKVYIAVNLMPNSVYVFEVIAVNKAGMSDSSDRLAIRTMPDGAPDMTPWVELVDPHTASIYYYHLKTRATSWDLPNGALLDSQQSFVNKHNYLQAKCFNTMKNGCIKLGVDFHPIRILVNRSNLLEDSLKTLYRLTHDELTYGPIRVTYSNEMGVDAGGIAKDWFIEVSKHVINDSIGLLEQTNNGIIIDFRSKYIHNTDCKWLYKSLGIFFAKCIYDGNVTGLKFNEILLMWLLNKPLSFEDIKHLDGNTYSSLDYVINNDVTDMDLTFSTCYELYDAKHMIDLIDNGSNIAVNNYNKRDYINKMVQWLLYDRYEPCISYFKEGFYKILSYKDTELFSASELQIILGGIPSININEIKANCEYKSGYSSISSPVVWFWEFVDELDNDTIVQLLNFITGCPCVPISGLRPPLSIAMIPVSDVCVPLPKAHTCFNQLDLPSYVSKDLLRDKLLYALHNNSNGFYIE